MANSIKLIFKVIDLLHSAGVPCAVFGGWAEELTGSIEPRLHNDIDLLCFLDSFEKLDAFINNSPNVVEIEKKHFLHKRAFIFNNVMVELLLVRKENSTFSTCFWGEINIDWPTPLTKKIEIPHYGLLNVVDQKAIHYYRTKYNSINQVRNKFLKEEMCL